MKILATGFIVADIVAADLPRTASPSEVVYAPSGISLHAGGNPANLSIDLVKLGLTPQDIGVVGAIGEDPFGKFIEDSIEGYGIRTFFQKSSGSTTSKNLILTVGDEDRRFHVDPGSNLDLELSHVLKVIEDYDSEILYLAVGITGIDHKTDLILRKAKENELTTFLDILEPHEKGWDFLLPALEQADIFHCNEKEALNMTVENDVEVAIEKLIEKGVEVVLLSKGGKGAILAGEDMEISQPAFTVDSVDPSGAGDAFCSGILFKLINNLKPEITDNKAEEFAEILMYGQAAGATACTGSGTTTAVSKEAVKSLIEKQKDKIKNKTIISS